jgi:hypothetical protein
MAAVEINDRYIRKTMKTCEKAAVTTLLAVVPWGSHFKIRMPFVTQKTAAI